MKTAPVQRCFCLGASPLAVFRSPHAARLTVDAGLTDPGPLHPETATMMLECAQRNQEVLQAYWNLLKLQPRWMWLSWLPS